ncbi:hypothetical protein [Flavobacterium macacae]|uniref:hypothetical protein n=1 Tax=Flavobacterium macacae TaxID=2488993 RepID=UPI00131578F8|nr:hypothetical protein [Flavobacterium macacae]
MSQALDKAQKYVGQEIKVSILPTAMSTESPLLFNGIIVETDYYEEFWSGWNSTKTNQ